MEKTIEIPTIWVLGIAVIMLLWANICHVSMAENMKNTYIVHMDKSLTPTSFVDHALWYHASLNSVSDSDDEKSTNMLYTYDTVIHGFSARLTQTAAQKLKFVTGVVSIILDKKYELHTTRTPSFLGLLGHNSNIFPTLGQVSNVTIGVLDTGVWPESPSFNDHGMSEVPDHWKGGCEEGTKFTKSMCNKKLVGAKYFAKAYESENGPINLTKESKSPRDDDGHGTHTSSTAAGSAVSNANLFGYANGTARGMAPSARIAMYKVCWIGGCSISDTLAGMESAINDKVDVMSLSLGVPAPVDYIDPIAVGAFRAMERGIFVSCSAGNYGPNMSSISNVAPWITTVGAGTLDRDFPAYVSLGDGNKYYGVSLYKGASLPPNKLIPFVYAGNVSNINGINGASCLPGTLIPEKVKGKLVLCDRGINPRVQKGAVVKKAGGAGMILANTATEGEELTADAHLLPAIAVSNTIGRKIMEYLFSYSNPTTTILFKGTKLGVEPSPVVAAFSSRGPSLITPEILKPDLIAPGVNILAGWSSVVGPTGLAEDTRSVAFNIMSGTSMSCPHVSGLAALLKAAHPEWSPAAIRSALMTTAYSTYENGKAILDSSTGEPGTPFDFGAGHVNPVSALDPGLIYDLTRTDYLNYLCSLNYPTTLTKLFTNSTCESKQKKYRVHDLNYPSFAVSLKVIKKQSKGVVYTRTLTNVGTPGVYKVSVYSSNSVVVSVSPQTLKFVSPNEKKSYKVTFIAKTSTSDAGDNEFGRIEWSDGKHVVGSPIAIIIV